MSDSIKNPTPTGSITGGHHAPASDSTSHSENGVDDLPQRGPSQAPKGGWNLRMSAAASRTFNPIRAIVDQMTIPSSKDKPVIPLSIGDPTVFGNLRTPELAVEVLCEHAKSMKRNGYPPSTGYLDARAAVAERFSSESSPLTAEDVIIASGCSGALAIALPALADPGDNVLLPRPGFSLYVTVLKNAGVEARFYDLLPDKQWEVDVEQVDSLVDERTRAILINNPSNPCGSNFSEAHLREILAVAEKHCLPVLSDEIYADMVFKGQTFTPIASLSTEVPVLAFGGLAKQYLVPGWRVGWILIHDRKERLADVRAGMIKLSQIVLGANSLAQSVIPALLHDVSESYYTGVMEQLESNARAIIDKLETLPGLQVIQPQGAMYVMVRVLFDAFRDIESGIDFCNKLLEEEHVFVLPGSCFGAPDFFRIVFCAPKEKLFEAAERMEKFINAHLEQ